MLLRVLLIRKLLRARFGCLWRCSVELLGGLGHIGAPGALRLLLLVNQDDLLQLMRLLDPLLASVACRRGEDLEDGGRCLVNGGMRR